MTRAAEKNGATVKDKKQDQDQAAEAKNQGKAAEAKDQRHQASGQGSVGQGGTDKQGHPLTKDGQVDHRIKSEK